MPCSLDCAQTLRSALLEQRMSKLQEEGRSLQSQLRRVEGECAAMDSTLSLVQGQLGSVKQVRSDSWAGVCHAC